MHLVHRSAGDTTAKDFFETRTNSVTWHSDVTYENQPPGTTFLYILDGPTSGGDTLFLNQAAAYQRLSPAFRERLHGLKAVHTAADQAANSKGRGGVVRREPVTSTHPLIRTHPVTGEKALYVNPQCEFLLGSWSQTHPWVADLHEQSLGTLLASRRKSQIIFSNFSLTTWH